MIKEERIRESIGNYQSAAAVPYSLDREEFSRYFNPGGISDLPSAMNRAFAQTSRVKTIISDLENSGGVIGTGVILSQRFFLTCEHVAQEMGRSGFFLGQNGEKIELRGSNIVAADNLLDFAVFEISGYSGTSIYPFIVTDPEHYSGDLCLLTGSPQVATPGRPRPPAQDTPVVSLGKIVGHSDDLIELLSPTANPGSSGGGVFVRDGALLGLISHQARNGAYLVRIDRILEKILE